MCAIVKNPQETSVSRTVKFPDYEHVSVAFEPGTRGQYGKAGVLADSQSDSCDSSGLLVEKWVGSRRLACFTVN